MHGSPLCHVNTFLVILALPVEHFTFILSFLFRFLAEIKIETIKCFTGRNQTLRFFFSSYKEAQSDA